MTFDKTRLNSPVSRIAQDNDIPVASSSILEGSSGLMLPRSAALDLSITSTLEATTSLTAAAEEVDESPDIVEPMYHRLSFLQMLSMRCL